MQLPLDLRLNDSCAFDNFFPGRNSEVVRRLERLAAPAATEPPLQRIVYLWGGSGTGKTHLLSAACRAVQARNGAAVYLPLECIADMSPAELVSLQAAELVCLDRVEAIAGDAEWERALFALFEACRSAGVALVLAALSAPGRIGIGMADLATRLGWGLVYPLHPLDDREKMQALAWRARQRGMRIPPEVLDYIFARYPRDMQALFAVLERVDRASLAQQRPVTIPLVRGLDRPLPGSE